ncbi:hypothetical protein EDC23_0934 [Thiohalophilus thiocyanatoxydans]|uniref:Uncharacterized protein n=1 Tax=Thiohalophilus thiocyanatoxydans TaxID=381308 RepID=A0A4R8IXN9_9GAMM|nr:hypothetical protein EDC23_0934 [Thiohalophilus thiocyanatoxydans]
MVSLVQGNNIPLILFETGLGKGFINRQINRYARIRPESGSIKGGEIM